MTTDRIVSWRIMCFEAEGDQLKSVIDLGLASIDEIKNIVCPGDSQEMCGSYPLTDQMIRWLEERFGITFPDTAVRELFLERDS